MPTVQQHFELSGKAATVTCAISGLGIVFTETLAEAGADVVSAAAPSRSGQT